MSTRSRVRSAGLVVAALAGLCSAAATGPASAADAFQDSTVVCSTDAGAVCAHVQYTSDPDAPLVRAEGTAPDGHQVTIDKVTLVERTYYMGVAGTTTNVAETETATDSGGQVTAVTASAAKQSSFYKSSVFYDVTVTYQIAGGAQKTVKATDNPVIPFP